MNTYTIDSFINFCDEYVIAEEGLFSKKFDMSEFKSHVKNKEDNFKCNVLINEYTVPVTVSLKPGSMSKLSIRSNVKAKLRELRSFKNTIQRCLLDVLFPEDGNKSFEFRRTTKLKEMTYHWVSVKISTGARLMPIIDGKIFVDKINKTIDYKLIREEVEKSIAAASSAGAGYAAGYGAGAGSQM